MRKIVFVMILVIILVSCSPKEDKPITDPNDDINENLSCNEDSDCVPAGCCHPTSCINKDFKEDCSDIFCSMECAPDTMDCGQGRCICEENKCKAEIE